MLKTRTTTDYGSGYGYGADPATRYALGAVVSTHSDNWKSVNGQWVAQASSETHNSYAWYAGAVLVQSTYRPDIAQGTIHTSSYTLGTSGQLTAVHVQDGRPRDIAFINDMAGQALRRDEADYQSGGDPHEVWYRFDGKQLGYSGNNGTGDTSYQVSIDTRATQQGTGAFRNGAATGSPWGEFDGQVTAINSYTQAGAGGSYTARMGDSLSGIAAQLWGDASLWYKLAQANGLSADTILTAGRILSVPAGVQRSRFASGTFKPFDPAEAMGDTSPTTPAPQAQTKAKKNKCGVFGQILLAVVAVAVTVVSAGAGAAAIAGVNLGQGITLALGGPIAAASGGTLSLSALGLATVGAAGAAAGSIVSQGVGVATGLQDKFSFKAVALAAISAGVGSGLAGSFAKVGGSALLGNVARGALGNLATQGIAVATGLQGKFDWTGVAIGAAVGGAIGAARIQRLGAFGNRLTSGMAGALAGGAARSIIDGSDFGDNVLAALPDVIGNTIGNMVAGVLGSGQATAPKPILLAGPTSAASGQLSEWDRFTAHPLDYGIEKAGDLKAYVHALMDAASTSANDIVVEGQRYLGSIFESNRITQAIMGRAAISSLGDMVLPGSGRSLQYMVSDRNAAALGRSLIDTGKDAIGSLHTMATLANPFGSPFEKAAIAQGITRGLYDVASNPGRIVAGARSEYGRFMAMDGAGKQEVAFYIAGRVAAEAALAIAGGELLAPARSARLGAIGDIAAEGGLGSISVPANLKYGTTLFGQEAHLQAGALLQARLEAQGVTGVINRTRPGLTGVDMSIDPRFVKQLGFEHIEIKPNTASGLRSFNTQVGKWGYDPATVRAVTYDAQGNLCWGFDF